MTQSDIPGPAVILLSGGLDSMVTAAIARERGHSLHALTIDYGQRHIRELQSPRNWKLSGMSSYPSICASSAVRR